MALVVEDGTGKPDAESYISVADASAYHLARGNAAWAALASDTIREQNLRKATDYMESQYGQGWKGLRVGSTQLLSWPRVDVMVHGYSVLSTLVPLAIRYACAELAIRITADTPLAPDLDRPTTSETVGPISVTYADGARQVVKYRAVDNLVAPYLVSSGASMKMLRS